MYTGCNILHGIGVIYEDHQEALRPFVSGLQFTSLCCTDLVHWRKCTEKACGSWGCVDRRRQAQHER